MPIWLALTAYATFLACLSYGRDEAATRGLLIVIATLLGVQFWKLAGMGDWLWIAFFVSWLAASVAIYTIGAGKRHIVTTCVVLSGVSLCYLWGRVAGQPFAPDAIQLIWADILGIVAWSIMAGPSIVTVGRNFALGLRRSGVGNSFGDIAEGDAP